MSKINISGNTFGESNPLYLVRDFTPSEGITNFSNNCKLVRQGNLVCVSITVKVTIDISAGTVIGSFSTRELRPPSNVVLPAVVTWETASEPFSAGVNVDTTGKLTYYGPSIEGSVTNRHICVNGCYYIE